MQQNETAVLQKHTPLEQTLLRYDLIREHQEQHHLSQKNKKFSQYMQRLETVHDTNFFISVGCWEKAHSFFSLEQLLCTKAHLVQKGGYFFRYKETGVAINPSHTFLESFSTLGLHLWHIDTVVVTEYSQECMIHIRLLHQLNKELNTLLCNNHCPPHVIRYFLHPDAFINYAKDLRPTFKEERDSIFCLETFESEEATTISEGITLFYKNGQTAAFLVRFNLDNGQSLGLVTQNASYEQGAEFFAPCTALITKPLESCTPSEKTALVLVSEFDAEQGDRRIEEVKRMRHQQTSSHYAVFPLDAKLKIDLDTLTFRLGDTQDAIEPHELVVVRTDDFAPLFYTTCNQML